jgi:hypothetical protein
LIAANKLDRIVVSAPVKRMIDYILTHLKAQPPEPENVHAGSADEEIKAKVGREGARTIPGMYST